MKTALVVVLIAISCPVLAGPRAACADQLRRDLPTPDPEPKSWEFPTLESNLVWILIVNGFSVVAEGDFDGDKKQDVAFLIGGGIPREQMIAACMSSTGKVITARNLNCVAGINTRPKRKGESTDSIGTSCFDDKHKGAFKYIDGQLQSFPDPFPE